MANVKKCDKCGKYYEVNLMDGLQFVTFNGLFHQKHYYDLCPDCSNVLARWLKLKGDPNGVDE